MFISSLVADALWLKVDDSVMRLPVIVSFLYILACRILIIPRYIVVLPPTCS